MFSKNYTTEDGQTKTVYASSQEDLDKAVEDTKSLKAPTYPNINVPVAKGRDLLETKEDLTVEMVDGRGAHNSPNNAVNDDGSLAGDPEVASPGAGEAPLKAAGTGTPVGDPTIEEPKEEKTKEDTKSDSKVSSTNKSK